MASHLVCKMRYMSTLVTELRFARLISSELNKTESTVHFTTKSSCFDELFFPLLIFLSPLDWRLQAWRSLLEKTYQTPVFSDHPFTKRLPQSCPRSCLQTHWKGTSGRVWCCLWRPLLRIGEVRTSTRAAREYISRRNSLYPAYNLHTRYATTWVTI